MLTPELTGVENKAMRPPVYGPGTYACVDCKHVCRFMGHSSEPIPCPDCKKPMTLSAQSNA